MRWLAGLLLLTLGACSAPGSLSYTPPALILGGAPVVATVDVVDRRDEKPNRIATIRGDYGNPLKVMDTPVPVAEEVRQVVTKALQARSMLSAAAPFRFQLLLHTLYGDQYMGRKVELMFDLVVYDRAAQVVYSDRINGKDYEFTFFDNGIFSSIDTLGQHISALLSKSVDEALDKPALHAALTARASAPAS